jgi:excinuclease ABC subunit A
MAIDRITVRGARQHNLKDINIEIPRDRLTVITGLSGSGKSSLAFDTIYAEGQRRYVESLSAYARQFLDQLERPDVDSVDGLSPAISIEQKTVSRSPRSTVGTVTEVYDYLRLLFSSIGQPHCHICGAPITRQSVEQIIHSVLALPEGERVMVLAPVVRGRKGEFKKELEKLQKDGFLRARVDGELVSLDEEIKLDKRRNHTIEAVVDRLLIKPGILERLTESVRTALKLTGGAVLISVVDGEEKLYSERMACVNCGINVPPLEPRSFSFNSVYGACKRCHGLGTILEIDPAKIVTDATERADKLFLALGAADKQGAAYLKAALVAVAEHFKADPQAPFAELPRQAREAFFHGVEGQITFRQGLYKYESEWKGAVRHLSERMHNAPSERVREALEELVSPVECPDCRGQRLQPESLAVRVGGRGIAEYTAIPIEEAVAAFDQLKLNERESQIAGLVLREIRNRMRFLAKVGLGYLTRFGHALGRRGAAHTPRHADRLATARRALRPRRALNRTAPARQPEAAGNPFGAPRPRQHSPRRRARRGDHPARGLRRRPRPGGGRAWRRDCRRGHARGGRTQRGFRHRAIHLRPALNRSATPQTRAQRPRRHRARRARQQPEEHRRHLPRRPAHGRHRRLGLGQVHAR